MHSDVRYNALSLMDVDHLIMENVKTQFEHDYKVTHTVSLVIQKLPENETAMQYISR
jgi:hypothetical protein